MFSPLPPSACRSASSAPLRAGTALLFALLLAGAAPAAAALFTVTRFDDQLDTLPGDGLCDTAGGGCALRAAVQEANALFGADAIYLPPGTYSLTRAGAGEDLAATGDLDVTSEVTLVGTGWGVSSVFMADFNDRLFEVHGFASLVLADLDAWGGSVDGIGGGVFVRAGGAFRLSRARIFGCLARKGGGVGTFGGMVTIEDSELSYNYAVANPPTWYASGAGVDGGGGSTIVVRRSSVHHNSTEGSLNGIDVTGSSLSIASSSVIDDVFGAYSVRAHDSDVEIVSSTVGSIQNSVSTFLGGSLTLGCSFLSLCHVGVGIGYTNYGFNVFEQGNDCVGPGDTDADWALLPLMAPPGRFAARVPPRPSAAVDGGHAFVCLADDQWGQTRPLDGDGDGFAVVDIGAVEARLIFFDGFGRGDTSVWSATLP